MRSSKLRVRRDRREQRQSTNECEAGQAAVSLPVRLEYHFLDDHRQENSRREGEEAELHNPGPSPTRAGRAGLASPGTWVAPWDRRRTAQLPWQSGTLRRVLRRGATMTGRLAPSRPAAGA